jgi:SanA protein
MIAIFLLAGFVTGLLLFSGIVGFIWWQETHIPEPADSEAIIVLGAQVLPSGEPSIQLLWRLEKALSAYLSKPMAVVVCGAQGNDEPEPEALAMRDWLETRGVEPDLILTDANSYSTRENIANAIALLPGGTRNVLIVTSDYHVPRAMQIARDLGLAPSGMGSPCKSEFWIKNHVREALAWCKYWLGSVTRGD